ncbi:MAG: hypothetical protein IJL89_02730 [Firmicutes bacterium]|nr:hypothetical protein [Bacillota bacterium]
MAASKNIKLPLASFGFAYLCGFIGSLYNGLGIVAEGVDENAAEITALTNEIIAGEVTAPLAALNGAEIATQAGTEISAVRIIS